MKLVTWPQRQRLYPALSVLLAVAIAITVCQFTLDNLEFFTYDLRVKFKPSSLVSGQVVTVALDQPTLKALHQEPRLIEHRLLIEKIAADDPQAIVYLIDPTTLKGEESEQATFASVVKETGKFVYAMDDLPPAPGDAAMKLAAPFDQLDVLAGPKTADKNIFARDGATRRMILSADGQLTIHPLIAARLNGIHDLSAYRGVFKFIETKQSFIDFRPAHTYKALSFMDVLASSVPTGTFRNKIVVVGRDTLETSQDYLMTPQSKDIVAMSNLEMHANMFDTLLLNHAPVRAPSWLNLILTMLISIFTLYVVITVQPARGLLILGMTVTGYTLFAYLLFAGFGLWVSMAHPLLALFICYYFFIPYRLIVENRKSWEYYQKNRLLTQVEELKSNFLRMMSHDLKTPLARIQGMANVVLSDTHPLTDSQRHAMSHIVESADELSDFIGSILSLGRIESKEIKLNLKSKDINALLTDVVNKLEFLARKKNITVICELEPMFSVRIDEDLLRQVFTNLVENAIKYSPENTKILVTTEEVNGKVLVQVADQGIGISSEELDELFTKFFRSRKVKNSEIPGSGLGLYLARYFVELHNGRIQVESEPQKGSTFSVELPMEM